MIGKGSREYHESIYCHRHADIPAKTKWVVSLMMFSIAALALRPVVVRQMVKRADAYLNYGMHRDAIRLYRRAVTIEPGQDRARNWLGYALVKSGEEEEAVRIFEEAVKRNPDNIVAWHDLGLIYAGKKEFSRAEKYFARAAEILPGEENEESTFYLISSLRFLAMCYEKLGALERSRSVLERILAIQPENEKARASLKRLKEKTAAEDE